MEAQQPPAGIRRSMHLAVDVITCPADLACLKGIRAGVLRGAQANLYRRDRFSRFGMFEIGVASRAGHFGTGRIRHLHTGFRVPYLQYTSGLEMNNSIRLRGPRRLFKCLVRAVFRRHRLPGQA